jgi:EmrB/QacA subfamily drug resistance transporter
MRGPAADVLLGLVLAVVLPMEVVPQETKETLALRRATAFAVNLGSFLTPFMAASLSLGLPEMGRELRMSAATLSWVASAFLLAAAVFTVPMGRIADIYGRRRILLYGNILFTIFSLLSAFAPSAAVMIVFRAVQGLGGAMAFSTAMAILTSVFPPGERGRVIGNSVTAVYMGLALGPFVGGFLTQHFGWRSIFVVNFLLGVVLVVVMVWKLRGEWAEARGESFDAVGAVVYGAMLVAWMLGLSRLSSALGVSLLAAGLLGLVAFVRWELRTESPVLRVSLFRNNPVFAFSSAAALVHYSATFAVTFMLSLYLQSVRGLSAQKAGAVLVAQPVMMALLSPTAGRLSDRIEPRLLASFGMTLTSVGILLLSFLGADTPTILVVANLVLLGVGFAFFSSPNSNAIMSSLERRHLGLGSGILGTMRLLGQNVSMGIVMMVLALHHLDARAVTAELRAPFVLCLRTIFWVFSALSVLGIFASLARGRVREAQKD